MESPSSFFPLRVAGVALVFFQLVGLLAQLHAGAITTQEYAAFLNDRAQNDSSVLYDQKMENDPTAAIQRQGTPGNYCYATFPENAMSSAMYINSEAAAAFFSWKQNGKEAEANVVSPALDVESLNQVDPELCLNIPCSDELASASQAQGATISINLKDTAVLLLFGIFCCSAGSYVPSLVRYCSSRNDQSDVCKERSTSESGSQTDLQNPSRNNSPALGIPIALVDSVFIIRTEKGDQKKDPVVACAVACNSDNHSEEDTNFFERDLFKEGSALDLLTPVNGDDFENGSVQGLFSSTMGAAFLSKSEQVGGSAEKHATEPHSENPPFTPINDGRSSALSKSGRTDSIVSSEGELDGSLNNYSTEDDESGYEIIEIELENSSSKQMNRRSPRRVADVKSP